MTRFCASCGTEVDETAVFCPTCGQPIDQETESSIPPAPSWPDPEPAAQDEWEDPPEPAREAVDDDRPAPSGWRNRADRSLRVDHLDDAEVTRVEARPSASVSDPAPADDDPAPAPPRSGDRQPGRREAPPAAPPPARSAAPVMQLPITTPVTLSGWLIGGGAALGALGALFALFDGLGSAIDLVLLIGLLAIAASVFLSDRLPHIPNLRLATLAVVLVAFGVALDRLGFGRAGAGELLLFLGTAAAAIGAILLETGRDQPLGGPGA